VTGRVVGAPEGFIAVGVGVAPVQNAGSDLHVTPPKVMYSMVVYSSWAILLLPSTTNTRPPQDVAGTPFRGVLSLTAGE